MLTVGAVPMCPPKKTVNLSCLRAANQRSTPEEKAKWAEVKHLLIRRICNFSRFQCFAKKSQYKINLIQLYCSLATLQFSCETHSYTTPLSQFNLCKIIKFSLLRMYSPKFVIQLLIRGLLKSDMNPES